MHFIGLFYLITHLLLWFRSSIYNRFNICHAVSREFITHAHKSFPIFSNSELAISRNCKIYNKNPGFFFSKSKLFLNIYCFSRVLRNMIRKYIYTYWVLIYFYKTTFSLSFFLFRIWLLSSSCTTPWFKMFCFKSCHLKQHIWIYYLHYCDKFGKWEVTHYFPLCLSGNGVEKILVGT